MLAHCCYSPTSYLLAFKSLYKLFWCQHAALEELAFLQRPLDLPQCLDQPLLQTALDSVSSGADLTQRLLTFAKQQPGLRRSRNVEQILHNISRMAHPLIEAQINFETAPPSEDLWVYCDPAQLDNALINLIINARDAILSSNQGDTITLFARSVPQVDADSTLRREHPNSYIAQGQIDEHQSDQTRQDNTSYRYIEFGVTDNGPGMSKEVKRRAVDPFFTTKDHGSGTGLGLSMVYGFVEQSSGELRIYSEADQGTTIRVLLPRGDESGNREEPVKLIRQKTGNGEKILLVEDDPHLLSLMNDLVSTLGYQTTCARSGAHALALVAADQSFDLMITDIVMPGNMDGFELAARMQEAQPTTRLLYMSGYTGYSKKDMGKVIAPLLQKPCGPVELGEAISEALRTQST